jgi:6-phosphogluconolactonase (cycloisomerase 2 family)
MRSRNFSSRWLLALLAASAVLITLHSSIAAAEDSGRAGFVYVMTNKSTGNSVIQYRRSGNGSLSSPSEVTTGGTGTGANGADPLGSQNSLVLGGEGKILLAANAGSNEISVLGVINDKLVWLSKSPSGGTFPNSVALFDDLVYVLNSQGTPNITGFRVDTNGVLHAIPNATVNLPSGSAGANDIRFTPDGGHLLVTVSGTNHILSFDVGDDGAAGSPMPQPSAGGSPFGIAFGHDGVVIVSEAAGSASSYRLSDDTLDVISGAVTDTQMASCWISVTKSARLAYVSNTGSGTISSFQISGRGEVSLLNAVAANPGGAPIDSSLSRDSRFLYVVESAQGKALIFRNNDSRLSPIGTVSVPVGSQGIAAE